MMKIILLIATMLMVGCTHSRKITINATLREGEVLVIRRGDTRIEVFWDGRVQ